MIAYLDPRDVEDLVDRLGMHVRDRNLLLSALAAPLPVFGEEVYPTLPSKAAALMLAINRDHPLMDGNKRLSWIVAKAFLALNGLDLRVDASEGDVFIRSVADRGTDVVALASWISARTRPL